MISRMPLAASTWLLAVRSSESSRQVQGKLTPFEVDATVCGRRVGIGHRMKYYYLSTYLSRLQQIRRLGFRHGRAHLEPRGSRRRWPATLATNVASCHCQGCRTRSGLVKYHFFTCPKSSTPGLHRQCHSTAHIPPRCRNSLSIKRNRPRAVASVEGGKKNRIWGHEEQALGTGAIQSSKEEESIIVSRKEKRGT